MNSYQKQAYILQNKRFSNSIVAPYLQRPVSLIKGGDHHPQHHKKNFKIQPKPTHDFSTPQKVRFSSDVQKQHIPQFNTPQVQNLYLRNLPLNRNSSLESYQSIPEQQSPSSSTNVMEKKLFDRKGRSPNISQAEGLPHLSGHSGNRIHDSQESLYNPNQASSSDLRTLSLPNQKNLSRGYNSNFRSLSKYNKHDHEGSSLQLPNLNNHQENGKIQQQVSKKGYDKRRTMPIKQTRKKLSQYSSQIIRESDEVNFRGPRYNGSSSRSYLALDSDMRSQFCKRSDFSTSFMYVYEDSSMSKLSRLKELRKTSLARLKKIQQVKKQEMQKTAKIKQIINDFQSTYQLKLSEHDKRAIQMQKSVKRIKLKYIKKRNNESAQKIQMAWKIFRLNRLLKERHQKKVKSATLIQQTWRDHYFNFYKPRLDLVIKVKNVMILQKFIRGKISYEKTQNMLRQARMLKNFSYFDKIREGIQQNIAIKLSYLWKKYKKRKQQIQQAKLRAKKKNTNRSTRGPGGFNRQQHQQSRDTQKQHSFHQSRRSSQLTTTVPGAHKPQKASNNSPNVQTMPPTLTMNKSQAQAQLVTTSALNVEQEKVPISSPPNNNYNSNVTEQNNTIISGGVATQQLPSSTSPSPALSQNSKQMTSSTPNSMKGGGVGGVVGSLRPDIHNSIVEQDNQD